MAFCGLQEAELLQDRDLRELHNLRCDVLFLQVELKLLKFHRIVTRFNPDQPRVPAGSPEGGQWTSDGAGAGEIQSGDEGRIRRVSDPLGRFKNDLLIHEMHPDAHTIKEHVGKSEEYLINRVSQFQADFRRSRFITGSFESLDTANKLVNSVMDAHADTVKEVAAGISKGAQIAIQFDGVTGYEAYAATRESTPYIRETNSVRVVIKHDAGSPFGYWIHTAFPSNR